MSGVCPKCISFHRESSVCPQCGYVLLSPAQWKEQRAFFLDPILAHETQPATETSPQDNKEFVLGFFLGALLFFFALSTCFLIVGDSLHL